ncbi:MAG TPA: hypothetical protein VE093_20290 [Polyangiaceae bacterium]|nr:hypothetical protein [Polyangiaceae bacterium]
MSSAQPPAPPPTPDPPAAPPPDTRSWLQRKLGKKPEDPVKPCKQCNKGKPCTKTYADSGLKEYGCWCGPDIAPARPMEKEIPSNAAEWDDWVEKKGLPAPKDGTDECCKKHDLELGRLRHADKDGKNLNLDADSVHPEVHAIHKRLSECFRREAKNKENNDKDSRFWAGRSAIGIDYQAWKTNPGDAVPGATGANASTDVSSSFGNASSSSAMTGAGQSFLP